MQTMPSAPAAPRARKRSSNAPGEGAAVSGRTGDAADLAPELLVRELDAVDELLLAESDRQRDDVDAERVGPGLREIAGAVGDDADDHETSRDTAAVAG